MLQTETPPRQRWLVKAEYIEEEPDLSKLWVNAQGIADALGVGPTAIHRMLDVEGGREVVSTVRRGPRLYFGANDAADWLAQVRPFSSAKRAKLFAAAKTTAEIRKENKQ